LPGELLADGPGPRPHGGVFDGDFVFERIRAGPRPTLDQVEVLARALKIGLRAGICHVDDERINFPMPARVAIPLADVGRQVRAPVHDDVALPALPPTHVVEYRDASGGLHDPPEASAERGSKFGQPLGQAAVRQRAILRAVVAIDAPEVAREVARGDFRAPRRGYRIVFSAPALRQLDLAGFGRLQQGETK